MTRKELRLKSGAYLNSLSRDELFERFLITRVSRIDTLDIIGVPTYSSCRPAARIISVNAGKSQNLEMARAGAIAEGIEFHTFEYGQGEYEVAPFGKPDLELPYTSTCDLTPEDLIRWEPITQESTGKQVQMPSELIWLLPGNKRVSFMCSSNGQAMGASFEDAYLQGLYEVVERDQTILRKTSMERLGLWPRRVAIPEALLPLHEKASAASLNLYLFDCQYDIKIPSYMAILYDRFGGLGNFYGCGCHLSNELAAERAILEAIQSRAVMISGARDDIFRRDYDECHRQDLKPMIAEIEKLPVHSFPKDYYQETTAGVELAMVLGRLSEWRDQIYYKRIDLGDIHLVKTTILGMEQPHIKFIDGWRPVRWEKIIEREQLAGAVSYLCRA
jgi:YcaO-like protein with predicted kinase domain